LTPLSGIRAREIAADREAAGGQGRHAGCMEAHGGPATDQPGYRAAETLTADPGTDPPPLRCFIVDDSTRFLAVARAVLESQGVVVVGVASTVAEAVRLMGELRPDVTLVDIDLGGQSGLELVRRMLWRPGPAPSPVVLISVHAEEDYADLIAASPAVGFLPKAALSAGAICGLLRERDGLGRTGAPRPE
jgi:CheY-like chemotaxis protein